MPTPPLPVIAAMSAGPPLTKFAEIDLDCDILVPADAGRLVGPATEAGVPIPWSLLRNSSRCLVTSGPYPLSTSIVTSVTKEQATDSSRLAIELMSLSKLAVDGTPTKRLAYPAGNLALFATDLFGQLGLVCKTGLSTALPRTDPLQSGDGETVWGILQPLAKQIGAQLWCDEAGIVHLEDLTAYYAKPPVAALTFVPGNPANNVHSYRLIDSGGEMYSTIRVIGHGAQRCLGVGDVPILSWPVIGVAVDPVLIARGYTKTLTIDDANARNLAQAQARAAHEIALQQVQGVKIEIEVNGWLNGLLQPFAVGQMVAVNLVPDGIVGPYFVAGRRLIRNLNDGSKTVLTLIEPGKL